MKSKFSSFLKVVLVLILVVIVNILAAEYFARLDLTTEKRYTLHAETKTLLGGLKEKVFVKVYLDGNDLPVGFKRMRRAIKETLEEFEQYGDAQFTYVFVNPTESEDKQVRFAMYKQLHQKGLSPIEAQSESNQGKTEQKMVFPGVIVSYGKKDVGVNLLKSDTRFRLDGEQNINNSIQALEYELTNAIRKLSIEKKPNIAFLEGHGELSEYDVMDMSGALAEYYNVQRGVVGGKVGILDPFKAVIIAQPTKPFSKADKYVIDQYIMKGGKVLWLVDGVQHEVDSVSKANVVAVANNTGLIDQLFRYGARVNPDLVQDLQCGPIGLMRKGTDGRPRIQLYRWPFFPVLVSNNTNVVNKYIPPIRTEYISTVDTVGLSKDVKRTVLLSSSKYTKIKGVPIHLKLEDAKIPISEDQFVGKPRSVAVMLEGKFASAFMNRPISDYTDNLSAFKGESVPTKMIVVGSGSIIRNEVSQKGEVIPLGFDRHARKMFKGNKEFLLNAVNSLCDDKGLMSIRNREIKLRLLDKERAITERSIWQFVNVGLPVLFFILFGIIWFAVRYYRFARTK